MTDSRLPYAEISEQTVIGQILVYEYCIKEAAQILDTDDFYLEIHRIIYKTALDLNTEGAPVDVSTVGQKLLDRNLAERIGGLKELSKFIDYCCTSQNLEYHAKVIKEKSALRNLVYLATDITARAARHQDPQQFLQDSKSNIVELAQVNVDRKPVESINEGMTDTVGEILKNEPPPGLVKTGITAIDKKCGGLASSLLTVVAGRPSMGKSAFLINIAINIGLRGGKVLYFTLEDAKQYQQRRMLARLAEADLERVMLNKVTPEESKRLIETQIMLGNRKAPLFWIQDSASTIAQITQSAVTHKATIGLDVLMVDHLGYVKEKGNTEYEITSNAVRGFANLAKELKIPLVLAVQLNRKIEDSGRKRPKLSDLRASGRIEEDARIVWFVHREHKDDKKKDPHDFELLVAKSSHGKTGPISLWCDMSQIWIRDRKEPVLDGYDTPHGDIGYN